MKRQLFALAMLTLLIGAGLQAETVMRANIPFNFSLGKSAMPAGDYSITCWENGLITLRELDGKGSVMTISTPGLSPSAADRDSSRGRLVFNRYGDEYFLHGVWKPLARAGQVVPETVRQKELARRSLRPEATVVAMHK